MTSDQLRAGLRRAMRQQRRSTTPDEHDAWQGLIEAGLLVLRAQEAAARPEPVRAPGLMRVWGRPAFAATGHYARDFPATELDHGTGSDAMSPGSCIHFNGAHHDLCKRGIAYSQFRPGLPCIKFVEKSARGGTYLKPGEVAAERTPWKYFGKPCPFYEEPTAEQVQADRVKTEANLQRTFAAIKVAAEWRVKPKPAQDRREVIECPVCKGRLHLSQSSYNGHVHGKCETDGCVSWME